MLNVVSTLEFDLGGYLEIEVTPQTTAGEVRRRMNRVATLDGGAVVNDGGYSEADRVIELAWLTPAYQTLGAEVERLVRLYTRLRVATAAGVFLAAPESYTPGAAESKLRLLVLSKESA